MATASSEVLDRPPPPSSRNNSQRNSKVIEYGTPLTALGAHTEETTVVVPSEQKRESLSASVMEDRPSSATSETSSGRTSGLSEYAEATGPSPAETPATVNDARLGESTGSPIKRTILYTAPSNAFKVALQSMELVDGALIGTVSTLVEVQSVKARYSLDAWTSYTDVQATRTEEGWTFLLPKAGPAAAEIQLAVAAQTKDGEIWDSRDGLNYKFV